MTTPKSFAIAITAVLLVALVVRLAVAVHYDPQPRTDAADYDSIGVSLAGGGGFPDVRWGPEPVASAFRPPLYPVALAGIYEISGTSDAGRRWEAARVVQALLGVAAVALIGLIALRIWGRREAVAASAIAAVYPPLLLVGSTLVSEALFIPLILLGIWLVLRYRDDARLRWLVLA
jgi:4-amino-4-deoxy-L-arabinose transferase-like glycosyltransferase